MFQADALFWFKIFGIVSVMGVGIMGSYIPFWFKNHKHADAILLYLNMFSAGVLMSTFTVHLLAESERKIVDAVGGYPIDYVIFGTGALLMVYLSRIGGIDHEDIHSLEQRDEGVSADAERAAGEQDSDWASPDVTGSSTTRESETDCPDSSRLSEAADALGGAGGVVLPGGAVGISPDGRPELVRVGRILRRRPCPRCEATAHQVEWAPWRSRGRGRGKGKGGGAAEATAGEAAVGDAAAGEKEAGARASSALKEGGDSGKPVEAGKPAEAAETVEVLDTSDTAPLLGPRSGSPKRDVGEDAADTVDLPAPARASRRKTPKYFSCQACGAIYRPSGRLLTHSEVVALKYGRRKHRKHHKRQSVAMSVFILLCGLMVHAVTSGLAIGLATDMVTCFNLWLCSILHKVAETVAQTLAGIRAGIDKKKNICLSIVLSMGDPFGQAAGLIIVSVISGAEEEAALYALDLFTEICIFLAAGTMCEIIFEELLYHNLPVKGNLGIRETSKRFAALLAGYIFLDLVAIIDM